MSSSTPPTRILFVDDDEQILRGIARMLRTDHARWQMTFICGGRAAVDLLREHTFDIVLTDLHMPEIGGIAVLKATRETSATTIRIVLTGSDVEPSTLDADAVLFKPMMKHELRAVLERFAARATGDSHPPT